VGHLSYIGALSILIGFFVMVVRARYRGEMEMSIGYFKGPVWFLLIVLGIFLMILDLFSGR
jgi:NADH:ubiquinone oxidoreductase subunit 6 (subunit J)